MIWMRRLHIINWMYYGIQTVELEHSTFLTGVTGSGKSSLIDAIQVVMLGETGGRFFNRSATGGKSDRTLLTYLRGKYSGDHFKRKDKAFSSYLVIDFDDDHNREKFCYGVAFDLQEDNTIEKDYFYVGQTFRREWAIKQQGEKTVARSRSEFKKVMKEQGNPLKLFTSGEYKSDMLVRLGIYDEHFFRVFRTAVAYVPLDKIEDFIVKNICHLEDNIDVPKMRAAIIEYRQMQRDMTDFQERQRDLEELKSIYEEFSTRRETYRTQEYIIQRAQVDRLQEEQHAAEEQMRSLDNEHDRCVEEEQRLSDRISNNQQRYGELLLQIDHDPATQRQKELGAAVEACNQIITEREKLRDTQLHTLKQRISAWRRRLCEVCESPAVTDLNRQKIETLLQALDPYSQYTKDNFARLDSLSLSEANTGLDRLRAEALTLQAGWKALRTEAERRAKDCRDQLSELEKGIKSYPKNLLALKSYLQDALSNKYNTDVSVSILADLITIADPAWVNTTEGYLRRQRLYFLVEPNYYRDAVRLFKQYSRENKCYQYRIIHAGSLLAETPKVYENSLAKVIESNHPIARKYVDYLLGRVERVDDIESVGGRRTAVTVDGMLYTGFTAARMNEEDWRMRYIGQDSIAQQIKEISRLLEENLEQVELLSCKIAPVQPLIDEKTLSDEFFDLLTHAVAGAKELPALEQKCEALWNELQRIDDSYVQRLKEERKSIEKALGTLQAENRAVSRTIGELEAKRNSLYLLSGEKEQAWEARYAEFLEMYPEGSEIAERTALRYGSELLQKGSAEKLLSDFEPALIWTKSRLDTLIQNFRNKAESFNRNHISASISTEISSDEWRRAYEEATAVHLEDFTQQIAAARLRAEEIFHNEFINQIKGNIDTVKREISLLNRALEEYTFGRVRYRFKCIPTENPEMRQYYDMITNAKLDGISIYDVLEQGTDLIEYEPLVKTLFQLISSEGLDASDRQNIEANIEKYKSFQTYLRFDLVEVGPDGKEYPLSQSMGSLSGGERQTPFYIAILASLMKTYRINQGANSLRLVVFDEAFDKIDTSRIEECVTMLKEIGFQSIVSAPDNKAPYISPLVERTWVVIKPNESTSDEYCQGVLYLLSKKGQGLNRPVLWVLCTSERLTINFIKNKCPNSHNIFLQKIIDRHIYACYSI